MEYSITQHAKQRYAERIMDRDNKTDIAVFVAQNEDKIKQDITKMIEFGEVLYEGVSSKEPTKNPTMVVLNGLWVVIIDAKQKAVITLYELDLGVGKEFNDQYRDQLLTKLKGTKAEYDAQLEKIIATSEEYDEKIKENDDTIRSLKGTINTLEHENENLRQLINDIETDRQVAEMKVRDIVAIFCGRKVF